MTTTSRLDLVVAGTARRRADGRVRSQRAVRGSDARAPSCSATAASSRSSTPSSSWPSSCAKEPWDLPAAADDAAAVKAKLRRPSARTSRPPIPRPRSRTAHNKLDAAKKKAVEALWPRKSRREAIAAAVQGAGERRRARRHPRHRPPDRRPRAPPTSGRSSPKSASCPAPTARPCSPAAKPRRSWSPRSAPARMSRSSTRWKASTAKTSCCTTTSRPTRSAKPAASARPGRREIGHGKLAWRAVRPLLPTKEQFPYTIRIVSEITESNGSSSMASVCGASLALMDAGVPLPRPVAGIAMGLIKEDRGFAVLSDILGDEDHLGDMDFKVAGTEKGVTALQMDIKITSITEEIMRVALDQARDGRLHILGEMAKAHDRRRATTSTRTLRASRSSTSRRKDPRRDRLRRQGDPRDRRARPAPRSTSRMTAPSRSRPSTARPARPPSTGSAASSRSRSSASSTPARSSRSSISAPS